MAEQSNGAQNRAVERWNNDKVHRCLLPVLRYVDGGGDEDSTPEEQDDRRARALEAYRSCPDAYRQLSHVYHTASEQTLDQWFGWIDCDPELLHDAFEFIDHAGEGTETPRQAGDTLSKDLYFRQLFRVTIGGESVDLAYPFEQYDYCDEYMYPDYLLRRLEIGDKCKAWIRRYMPYYTRIHAWYLDNGGRESGVSREYCAYMELFDYFLARISYEDRLRDERQALEYERGGLGWFHHARKRELDARLAEVSRMELKMRLDDTEERCEAYEAQFASRRAAWQEELENAPWTAFGRRRELKEKLAELERQIREYRDASELSALKEAYRKLGGR